MTGARAFLAIISCPLIVIFVFDWIYVLRYSRRGLPNEAKAKVEREGRPLILVRFAILLLVLRILVGSSFWHIVPIASHSRPWLVILGSGFGFGIVLLGIRRAIALLWPPAAANSVYFLHGSSSLWIAIFIVGAFVEEFWRALCISGVQQNGGSALLAGLLTAVAFGIAHVSGLPSRVLPGGTSAEMLIGFGLGAVFLWSNNLFAPALASLVYFSATFFLVRVPKAI